MRKILLALALLFAVPAFAQTGPGPNSAQRFGSVWVFAAVTLGGSSQTLLANATQCSNMIVTNPSGNAIIYVDPSGGTAASTRGIPVPAGTWLSLAGAMSPCGPVTVIGTNTQIVQVWSAK